MIPVYGGVLDEVFLERRPRVYDSFPMLCRHVLSTADTTNVEYVAALLEFETTAVDRFQ